MSLRVMITGGASGIGWAIASAFAGNDAKVHICDVDEGALRAVTETCPQIGVTRIDVTDEAAIDQWFNDALDDLNGLDVLINNAGGGGRTGYVEELMLDDWRRCLSLSLDAQFLCVRRAAPVMKRQRSGSIINISSIAGLHGYYPQHTPYAAAKWGVIGFTKTLAVELGPYDVRVNAVCPGNVEGASMEQWVKARAEKHCISLDLVNKELMQTQSIKRFVKAEEIADLCLFLASPASKMVTGQAIAVDGNVEVFHL